MTDLKIDFQLKEQLSEVTDFLKDIGFDSRFRRKIMEKALRIIDTRTKQRFNTLKRDPDSIKWAALSPNTLREKRKKYAVPNILIRTGKLRDSIKYALRGDKITLKSVAKYGKYHQFGTKKMPARPFIGLDKFEEQRILREIERELDDLF